MLSSRAPVARAALIALALVAAVSLRTARGAYADRVEDPATHAFADVPDGWTSLVESRPTYTVHRRLSPDGKGAFGLLAGPLGGDLEALLATLEAYWREGPETFTRISKADVFVVGLPALRVEWRIDAAGRPFRALALLRGASGTRAAAWVAWDATADADWAARAERMIATLDVRPAPAATPPAPRPPPRPPAEDAGGAPSNPSGVPGERMFEPRFREGAPSTTLAAGDPPLLRGSVDAFVDLAEAAYDLALLPSEEQRLRDGFETGWADLKSEVRRSISRATAKKAAVTRDLARGDDAAAVASLAAFAAETDGRIEETPSAAWSVALRAAKARRGATFSSGEVPVLLAAADAYEQIAMFLLGLARNEIPVITSGQSEAVRADLAKSMDLAGSAARRNYARLHRLWLILEARWDSADPATRLSMRWAAVELFRRLAGKDPAPDASRDLPAYASAAARVAAEAPVFDAYAAAMLDPTATIAAALAALGMQAADLDGILEVRTLGLR